MPVYKKRSESSLVAETMRYLAHQEFLKRVIWFSRLQSGAVKVVKGWKGKRHEHFMQLCRKGTPDIMAVLTNGTVLWLELKTKTGKLRPEQEVFKMLMQNVDGHKHLTVRTIDDIQTFIKGDKDGNNS